jgi:hypothetical protein
MSTLTKMISRDVSVGWGELIFRSVELRWSYVVLELKVVRSQCIRPPALHRRRTPDWSAVFVVNAFLKMLKF